MIGATSASPGNAPVPPSSESRSSASAEYPLPTGRQLTSPAGAAKVLQAAVVR
jgi:hypothetical protein